jgi:hypothetical protein
VQTEKHFFPLKKTEKHFSFPDFMLFGAQRRYLNRPDLLTAMGDHSEVDTCLMQSLHAFLLDLTQRSDKKNLAGPTHP